ncbi:MAG: methyl-accepting chemotaxis protein [Pseudomonadota bacterium]
MQHIKISTAFGIGMGLVLTLLVGLAGYSIKTTLQFDAILEDYSLSAQRSSFVNDVNNGLAGARLAAFSYRTTGSDAGRARFEARMTTLQETIQQADIAAGQDAEFKQSVKAIGAQIDTYARLFERATALRAQREDAFARLTEIGDNARKRLVEVMQTAFADDDVQATAQAGLLLQDMLQGQLYMERYLVTLEDGVFDNVIVNISAARGRIDTLLQELQNPRRRELTMLVEQDLASYLGVSEEIKSVVQSRIATYAEMDAVGPRIAGIIDTLVAASETEQKELGEGATELVDAGRFWLPTISIIAVLFGALLAFLIARWLAQNINTIIGKMDSLADGDLETEIEGADHKTEIGRISAALIKFRDRAVEARENATSLREVEAREAAEAESRRREEESRQEAERAQQMETERREAAAERQRLAELAERDRELAAERDRRADEERAQLLRLERVKSSIDTAIAAAINGDLTQRVDSDMDDPSLSDMAKSINALLETTDTCLSDATGVLSGLADGDLRQRLDGHYAGIFDRLKTTMNTSLETLSELIVDVRRNGGSVSSGSAEIRSAADEMAKRTESNAAAIEQTTAALVAFGQSVSEVTKSVEQVAAEAEKAKEQAQASGTIANGALQSIQDIVAGSDEISEIVGMIEDISFQINLLSLNAGVEAARAGEAGRGFSVVATEIRSLAQRTNDAVGDITKVISTSREAVDKGAVQVQQSTSALESIVTSIVDISSQMSRISKEVSDQDRGVGEISTAMRDFDGTIQRNAAMCEELNAGSDALASDAAHLDTLLTRFQVTEAEIRSAPAQSLRVANG